MGVTIWEIMTFGNMPYPGLTNQRVIDEVRGVSIGILMMYSLKFEL